MKVFEPVGGSKDSWPVLNSIIREVSHRQAGDEIHFVPVETYVCGTPGVILPYTRLFLNGAHIACKLQKSPSIADFKFNHVFTGFPMLRLEGGNALVAKLSSSAARGSIRVSLEKVPPGFSPGDRLRIYKSGASTSKLGGAYVCMAIDEAGITLDRPLCESFQVEETSIDFPVQIVQNVLIDGGGSVLYGWADGVVEFSSTDDCVVQNMATTGDFAHPINGGVVFAFDVFGRRNVFRDILINQRTGGYGFSLETNESSLIERCTDMGARDPTTRAFWIGSSHGCAVRDSHAGAGTVSTVDGSDNAFEHCSFYGGRNGLQISGERNRVTGCRFQSIVEHAVILREDALEPTVRDCSFLDCGNATYSAAVRRLGLSSIALENNHYDNCYAATA